MRMTITVRLTHAGAARLDGNCKGMPRGSLSHLKALGRLLAAHPALAADLPGQQAAHALQGWCRWRPP